MKKSFLISTGGSGGHVMPAIILQKHLSKEANIVISTDKRGLKYLDQEAFVTSEPIKIIPIPLIGEKFRSEVE